MPQPYRRNQEWSSLALTPSLPSRFLTVPYLAFLNLIQLVLCFMTKKADIRVVFGRCRRIRTSDPFVPNEVRYQAAPHTDTVHLATIPSEEILANVKVGQ